MINAITKFFQNKSIEEKLSEIDKSKYRIIQFENGQYGYEHECLGEWLRPNTVDTKKGIVDFLHKQTLREIARNNIKDMPAKVVN